VDYYISKFVDMTFGQAVARTREELAKEGFSIPTEIDVRATFKQKLGVDFRPYLILGACHTPSAYKALMAEDKIGVLLPCNVIVQQHEDGRVEVVAMDPKSVMAGSVVHDLARVAEEVQMKLRKVLSEV